MKALKSRSLLGALGLLALIATPVLAAGLWPNLPIVGGAAFCSTTNTAGVPGTAAVCNPSTPAGPSVVTGLETIPADTHAASGAPPQTVNLTLASLNALPVTVQAGSIAGAQQLTPTATSGGYILTGSAPLSATTIFLPSSPIDGQQFRISSTQTIASLTVTTANGSGQSVSNAPTALTVSTTASYGYQFKWNAAAKTWYRID